MSGDGVTIAVVFHKSSLGPPASYSTKASGHTSFTTSKGTRTFDRTGVEDSFYLRPADTALDFLAVVTRQLEKVEESRKRIDASESIPGIPFMVTPESKAQITAALLSGKSHSFYPSGFGTGYVICARPMRHGRSKPEAAAFFGVDMLFVEALDAD
jgi:hypothetical protein